MKKYLGFLVIAVIFLQSCDPGGMSFVRNNSSDTLKLQLVGNYNSENTYCKSFYENIYYSNNIVPNRKLDDWYDIMEVRPSIILSDSLLEIVVPPKSTIVTNSGIASFRLFKRCASDYVIFKFGEHTDTLFDIAMYNHDDLMDFYNRNDMNLTTKSGLFYTVNITDLLETE